MSTAIHLQGIGLLPRGGDALGTGSGSLKGVDTRLVAIRSLLLAPNQAENALLLLTAFLAAEPTPISQAQAYAFLLNHEAAAVRRKAGVGLAALQDKLPNVDLLPVLFAAWKREPVESVRRDLGEAVQCFPCSYVERLGGYYEQLSYSVHAKTADMGIRSTSQEPAPDMFERALILLHLDHSSEAKRFATAALYTRFRRLDSKKRDTLSISLVYALSDVRIAHENVLSNLLYIAEQSNRDDAEGILPFVRLFYGSEKLLLRADAALVGLCLGENDSDLVDLVCDSIVNPMALSDAVEPLDLKLPTSPAIDFEDQCEVLGRWVEAISGLTGASSEIHKILDELQTICHEGYGAIVDIYQARIEGLYKRFQGAAVRGDELSRELFMLRVVGLLDRVSGQARPRLVQSLLKVMEDHNEPLLLRQAVISGVVYSGKDREVFAARVRQLMDDEKQPGVLRGCARASLAHLSRFYPPPGPWASTESSSVVST